MKTGSYGARQKRVDINLEFDSIESFIREYVSNLSKSGAFIRSKEPLPLGTRVKLRFTVMLDDPEILEGIGQVVRHGERPRGMGVVFVELGAPSRKLIERLLTRPLKRRRRSTQHTVSRRAE